MAIRSKDLAKMLGVSTATMSLVLNDKPGISEELRASLITKVKELGYGYMLKGKAAEEMDGQDCGKRKNIAYLIYNECCDESNSSAFYPPVLEGAEREAREFGYHLVVMHMSAGKDCSASHCVNSQEYAGIIVQLCELTDGLVEELEGIGIPFVTIDCYSPKRRVSSVTVNNEQAMHMIIRFLADCGHSHIAYLRPHYVTNSSLERRRCFYEAMKSAGLNADDSLEILLRWPGKDGQEDMIRYFKEWKAQGRRMPTAIVAENDMIAWPLYKALEESGYSIPKDVSVVGFDDRAICTIMEPALTTVRSPRQQLGRQAVHMLVNKIMLREKKLEDLPMKLELHLELVVRDSVRNYHKDF